VVCNCGENHLPFHHRPGVAGSRVYETFRFFCDDISSLAKIYLHAEPVDMRKSFDGLFGILKSDLHLDVREVGVFMQKVETTHCTKVVSTRNQTDLDVPI